MKRFLCTAIACVLAGVLQIPVASANDVRTSAPNDSLALIEVTCSNESLTLLLKIDTEKNEAWIKYTPSKYWSHYLNGRSERKPRPRFHSDSPEPSADQWDEVVSIADDRIYIAEKRTPMTKDGHIYGETYKYWVYDMERFRGTMTEDYMAVGTRKYSCAKGIQSKF